MSSPTPQRHRLALVGARGHVGAELVALLARHPALELAWVGSRERAGQPLAQFHPDWPTPLRYSHPTPAGLVDARADAVILALPNGGAADYVAALDGAGQDPVLVDLSADYRFDEGWFYGLPELHRDRYRGQRRISNPGCYATAMQLALAPMRDLLDGPVQCFGVSGHSGAGTAPSERNDPAKLRDNLMPYALTGHVHEREVSRHLGHPVEFMPHVAAYFRGITLTANLHLAQRHTLADVRHRYDEAYAREPLVRLVEQAPWVSAIAGQPGADVGGWALSADGRRLVVVATLDNLLKGAATQALQNLNLALGLAELTGIAPAALAPSETPA